MEPERPDDTTDTQRSGSFVERIASHLGGAASVRTVYGAPIERDGTTVIPVAKVRYGFGGGSGRGAAKGQEGGGAGGGVQVSPVGYIEMSGGAVKYRRIRAVPALVSVLGMGLAVWLAVRPLAAALGSIVRRRRLEAALGRVRARQRGQKM